MKVLNLLIVDDEVEIIDSLAQYFELDGHNVFTATGGYAALEIVKKERIDFIISDVRMPEGDGKTLLEEVRKINSNEPPLLLISGYTEITPGEAKELGAIDMLAKPIDFQLLDDHILRLQANSTILPRLHGNS